METNPLKISDKIIMNPIILTKFHSVTKQKGDSTAATRAWDDIMIRCKVIGDMY